MPTNGFSTKPLKLKLLAGEHKATEKRIPKTATLSNTEHTQWAACLSAQKSGCRMDPSPRRTPGFCLGFSNSFQLQPKQRFKESTREGFWGSFPDFTGFSKRQPPIASFSGRQTRATPSPLSANELRLRLPIKRSSPRHRGSGASKKRFARESGGKRSGRFLLRAAADHLRILRGPEEGAAESPEASGRSGSGQAGQVEVQLALVLVFFEGGRR